jgi:hypothetical protein
VFPVTYKLNFMYYSEEIQALKGLEKAYFTEGCVVRQRGVFHFVINISEGT